VGQKFNAALENLEKARVAAFDAAVADKEYRVCAKLDTDGTVQRSLNKVRKLVTPKEKKVTTTAPTTKK